MKTLSELIVGTDEISGALYTDLISQKLIKAAEAYRVGRDLVEVNVELVGNEGTVLTIPKVTTVEFTTHTQGASLTCTQPTFSVVTVQPVLMSCGIRVTNEALEASKRNLLNSQLEALAVGAARIESQEIVYALLDCGQTVTTFELNSTSLGTEVSFDLSGSGILEVLTCTITGVSTTIAYTVDHMDGHIKFATAPGSNQGIIVEARVIGGSGIQVHEAISSTILNLVDVTEAIRLIKAQNFEPDVIAMNPNEYKDICDTLTSAADFGAAVVMDGSVKRLYGLKLVVSNQIPQGVVLVADAKAAGILAIKRNFTVEYDRRPGADSIDVIGTQKYAAAILNEKAIVVIVGAQSENYRA